MKKNKENKDFTDQHRMSNIQLLKTSETVWMEGDVTKEITQEMFPAPKGPLCAQ